MVGVAGRSKGCITCRKRRVKCDQVHPNCGRCTKSKRFCEGYDSFPVFINRTTSGLERRRPLDEVKPRALVSVSPTNKVQSLQQEIHSEAIWHEQFISELLRLYGVFSHKNPSENIPAWLYMSAQLVKPSEPLRLSLRAIAMTRIGRMSRNAGLHKEGVEIYCKALSELQKALYDSEQMWEDETLVTARALHLYEVFESSTYSLEAWNNHLSGITRLVLVRGPERHRAPIARATLEEQRYNTMIQSLHFRERNPLAGAEWRSAPPRERSYNGLQRLCDIGLDVGALAEDLDLVLMSSELQHGTITPFSLLSSSATLESELEVWFNHLQQTVSTPVFWDAPHLVTQGHDDGQQIQEMPLAFESLDIAKLVTTFWTVRLLLFVAKLKLLSAMQQGQQRATKVPERPGVAAPNQTKAPSQASVANDIPTRIQALAVLINRSTAYFLSDEVGQEGPLRILFPLRVALATFETMAAKVRIMLGPDHPRVAEAEQYHTWCQASYKTVVKEKQVKYARDLENASSLWERPVL